MWITAKAISIRYLDKNGYPKEGSGGLAARACSPREEVQESPHTPWRLVLLGAPGIGKGTQADLLHQKLGACHL